ncbi:MAG: hypothetical protein IKV94_02650 [Clostridia bacterium]|nr:hypothetical protein [Clostridia bacterium]MBR6517084.1 hypothetical protein [Bacilli bacterium]
MSVSFKPNTVIMTDLGLQEGGPIHKFFTNTCYLHMDEYVPFDSGDLASIVSISTDGKYITYEVPYASYQYYGVREDGTHQINEDNRNRSMHPKATSFWVEKMVTAEKNDIIKEVQDELKRRGGQ